MLAITLALTDTDQSARLLALLETLPFVEITERQRVVVPADPTLLELFNRYLKYASLGFSSHIWTGPIHIDVFNGIAEAVAQELGSEEKALYAALAQDPGLFEGQLIMAGEKEAHCVYRLGYRVLYELDAQNNTLQIFHVTKAQSGAA